MFTLFSNLPSVLRIGRRAMYVLVALTMLTASSGALATLANFQANCGNSGCHLGGAASAAASAPNGPNFNAAGSDAILTQANANGMNAVTTNFAAIAAYIDSVKPTVAMTVPYRPILASGSATRATVGDIYLRSTYSGIVGIDIVANGSRGVASFSNTAGIGNPTADYTPSAGVCGADTFTYRGAPSFTNANNSTYTTTRTANVTITNPVLNPNSFTTSVAYNSASATTISLAGQFSGDAPTTVEIVSQPSVGAASGSIDGANTVSYTASAVTYSSQVTIQYRTTACGVTSATRTLTVNVGAPPAPVFTTPAASPSNAPAGLTGVAYSYQVAASSSNTAAVFSLASGSVLPAGLSLASNGTISGTPSTIESPSVTITAKNLNTTGTDMVLNFSITKGPPIFTSAVTVNGAVGGSYTALSPLYTITATNSPTSFTASGLPAGLTLDTTTGKITGTPTTAATNSFTLTASNGVNPAASQSVQFNISNVVPVITSSGSVPGQTGVFFSYQITAINAPSATGYGATNLPAGLSVTSGGLINGTPTTISNNTVTLTASNSTGPATPVNITIPITLGPPVITSANTASGAVGIAFAGYQITATNSPTSFSATGLPTGLGVNGTGFISGIPGGSGSFVVTVGASNGVNPNASQSVTFNIAVGVPAVTSATTASLQTGQAFSYQIAATNGPSGFSATGLPTGLSMNASGLITGTTYQIGVFPITLSASNGTGTGSTATLTLTTTLGPPVFTSATTANIVVTQAFNYQITAQNNPTSFSATGLPAGLAINTANGLVSGTPQTAGTYTATLTATNATGPTAQAVIFTSVNPPAPTVAARASTVPFNTATAIDVSSSISGQYNSIAVSTAPLHGTASVAGAVITYTPTRGYFGTDTLAFTATGLGGTSAPAVVNITIGTQVPTAAAGSMTMTFNTSGTLDLAPLIQGSGISGARIATAPAHGTATLSGTVVTYTPAHDYFGTDSFAYVAIGNAGSSTPALVTVTITGRPDPTKNAAVTGMVANVAQTALRFSQAQVSNFGRHMEGLRRPGGAGGRNNLASNNGAGYGSNYPATTGAAAGATAAPGAASSAFGSTAASNAYASGVGAGTGALPMPGANSATRLPTGTNATASLPVEQGVTMAMNQFGVPQASLVGVLYNLDQNRKLDLGALRAAFNNDGQATGGAPGNTVWVEGVVSFGSRDASGNSDAAQYSSSGVSIGMDIPVNDNFTWGIGLGLARDSADIGTDGTHTQAQGYSLAAYGSHKFGKNGFVEGMLGIGTIDYDMRRWVDPMADFALSNRKGTQVFGSVGGGLEYRANGRMVSPYTRLDFSQDKLQEVTETGAGNYALHYFEQTNNAQQAVVGLRGESTHSTSFGWAVPRARVEWRQDLLEGSDAVISYADQIGGTRYAIAPTDSRRSALVLGLGSEFLMRDGWSLGLDYQLSRISSVESSYALRVRLSKELGAKGPRKMLDLTEDFEDEASDVTVESSVAWDDNIGRAKLNGDIRADTIYTVNVSRTLETELGDNSRLLLTGFGVGERFQSYNGLSHVGLGLDAAVQYRASGAFSSPTWSLNGKLAAEGYQSSMRDGVRYSLGASVLQPVTDRINLFGALGYNIRNANSSVFSTQDTSLRMNVDYALLNHSTVYLSGEFRDGDIVSSGRRSLENITIARAASADNAYPDGSVFSYRLQATTWITTLGYNIGLGARDSLDVSWRYVQSTPGQRPSWATSPGSYVTNQLSASYLMRF